MNTIYIDMDGVVADFETSIRDIFAAVMQQKQTPTRDSYWQVMRKHQHFYRDLPKMPLADQLMALTQRFEKELGWRRRMLTAIPQRNDLAECFQDKFDWMQQYYPGVRICFGPYSEDKQHHCQPGDILIDDKVSNCEEWRTRGGRALWVERNQYAKTLEELAEIFEQLSADAQSAS